MRVLLMSKSGAGLLAVLLLTAGMARAEDKEKEPFAILEIGGAGEWGLQNGGSSFGPSVAAEFDVIKEWLEIEAGFTPCSARVIPSGALIFSSRSRSPCPRP
jgi:hypothetical protein